MTWLNDCKAHARITTCTYNIWSMNFLTYCMILLWKKHLIKSTSIYFLFIVIYFCITCHICMRLCLWACSHWLGITMAQDRIRCLTLTFLSIFMPHILICHMYWHPPPGGLSGNLGTRLHLMLSLNNILFISALNLCSMNIHLIWLTLNHVLSKQLWNHP